MQATKLPTKFVGMYLGKSREAGSFEPTPGEKRDFAEAHLFSMTTPDGLISTVPVPLDQLDNAADFDCSALAQGDLVAFEGTVSIGGDRPGRFRPTSARRTNPDGEVVESSNGRRKAGATS